MIDKYNITIHSKNTKKIRYRLNLDRGDWFKSEYDAEANETYFEMSGGIYYEMSGGIWYKKEYNTRGELIYSENSDGHIRDDRKI